MLKIIKNDIVENTLGFRFNVCHKRKKSVSKKNLKSFYLMKNSLYYYILLIFSLRKSLFLKRDKINIDLKFRKC